MTCPYCGAVNEFPDEGKKRCAGCGRSISKLKFSTDGKKVMPESYDAAIAEAIKSGGK